MKRIIGCLLSLNLLAAGPALADCTIPAEQAAFDVGALKSELSILAIACSNQNQYNQFVERYRTELVAEDQVVNAWFNKSYGRNGRSHYDSYITLLANEQSNVGQHEGSDFCPRLGVLFSEAMAVPDLKLLPEYAAAKNLIPAALTSCAVEGPPARAEPHRAARKK